MFVCCRFNIGFRNNNKGDGTSWDQIYSNIKFIYSYFHNASKLRFC